MGTRNTPILQEIVEVLSSEIDDAPFALEELESHFHDALLVNAGNLSTIGLHAEQLRLSITAEECAAVLDEIARRCMAVVSVDYVEETVYDLFGNRFIEP